MKQGKEDRKKDRQELVTICRMLKIYNKEIAPELVYILGVNEFKQLCANYGGKSIKVPLLKDINKYQMFIKLVDWFSCGRTDYDGFVTMYNLSNHEMAGLIELMEDVNKNVKYDSNIFNEHFKEKFKKAFGYYNLVNGKKCVRRGRRKVVAVETTQSLF